MDDGVIDIRHHLDPGSGSSVRTFAVWGDEGENAHFALPVWRALSLVGGDLGGLYYTGDAASNEPVPIFVLDLSHEPARTSFRRPPAEGETTESAPRLLTRSDGGVVVFLGENEGRRWFLDVSGGEDGRGLAGKGREELLFLAGECAGLLFFRGFAKGTEKGGGE